MQYFLAVDIGASSGRHILGTVVNGKILLEQIYRFENTLTEKNGHLCWDVDVLRKHLLEGLKAAHSLGKIPTSMGIDTWGVDFVLLDEHGNRIGDTVAYRDKRTDGMDQMVESLISFDDLYHRTGIQKQPYNTIYQLAALKRESPEKLNRAAHLLMMPDYLNFCLTGNCLQEYTNATTTALVNAQSMQWDTDLLDALGYPRPLFGALSMPGTEVGGFSEAVKAEVGFGCKVILPATHDTGSAYLAVPAKDEKAVYLSSGTWSLLGVERTKPLTTDASRLHNFSNEGGYGGRFRYLKNIMGLWMLQSIRRNLGETLSFPELGQMAKTASGFQGFVNVNDLRFLAPKSMLEEVRQACIDESQPFPSTDAEVLQCVYQSLARSYAEAIAQLSALTGTAYQRIHIVGGGSQDAYLNQLTADWADLPVSAGPVEGTALGNLMAQMIAAGAFENLAAARVAIPRSFALTEYESRGISK